MDRGDSGSARHGVSYVAKALGVSAQTVRNLTASGELNGRRNPVNGYRQYAEEDIEAYQDRARRTEN